MGFFPNSLFSFSHAVVCLRFGSHGGRKELSRTVLSWSLIAGVFLAPAADWVSVVVRTASVVRSVVSAGLSCRQQRAN